MGSTTRKNHKFAETDNFWRLSPDLYAAHASEGKWKRYPHVEFLGTIIRETIAEGNGRLIVTMPPRHGKSELISVWTPTWFLDLWPDKRIILASYGERLSRHFGRRIRNNCAANPHVDVKISADSKASTEFSTTDGGGLLTVGIGGGVTGRGGDLMIIDDALKNMRDAQSKEIREGQVEWFNSTFYTRKEPNASIILLMTRWHEKDLAGYLMTEHEDPWKIVNLPAIAGENDPLGREPGAALCPERYDEKALSTIAVSVGSRVFASLYQGAPTEKQGTLWKRKYWKRWKTLPENLELVIQSWDANMKEGGSSYAVGQILARVGADRYILDQVRGKWGFTDLVDNFRKLSAKWPQAFTKLVENKANGLALQNQLEHEIEGIILVQPLGGKEVRAMACEPELEAGNVYLPEDEVMYPWVKEFIDEAAAFPKGENDDQVDAASQGLIYLKETGSFGSASRDDETKISKLRRRRTE